MVSPASTYVGLTTESAGARAGEPERYFPTGTRTFLRIVPNDTIQAKVLVTVMKQDHCARAGLANARTDYAEGLAKLVRREASKRRLTVLGSAKTATVRTAAQRHAFATRLKSERARCFLAVGMTGDAAARLYESVAAVLPGARLYGSAGVCSASFAKRLRPSLARRFKCTGATLALESYQGGRGFEQSYRARYGGRPDPYAIYGYEAAQLFIDAITGLGDGGTNRSAVRAELFATRDRLSVIGTYSFDPNGDTSTTDYGVYDVGANGDLRFDKPVKPG